MIETNQICPCGSGNSFASCCEQVINGERESLTAEELMRARYSAFASGAIEFIVASTHSSTRQEVNIPDITEWSQTSTWRGLQIIETKHIDDYRNYVFFEAQFTSYASDRRALAMAPAHDF